MSPPKVFTSWRKTSRSKDDAECVEVGQGVIGNRTSMRVIGVRDTKHLGNGPILEFSPAEWGLFLERIKQGDQHLT